MAVRVEKRLPKAFVNILDLDPNSPYDMENGLDERTVGDVGTADGIPGARSVFVLGLKSREGFIRAIRTGTPVREIIKSIHEQGSHVGLTWRHNEITVFVARHRNALIALGAAGAAGTAASVGGIIYLTRRSSKRGEK